VLLAGALDCDPVIEWLVPDPEERVVVLHRLLAVDVDHAIETGNVDVTVNLSAAAVWRAARPGRRPLAARRPPPDDLRRNRGPTLRSAECAHRQLPVLSAAPLAVLARRAPLLPGARPRWRATAPTPSGRRRHGLAGLHRRHNEGRARHAP
jgi:hypothetical protein